MQTSVFPKPLLFRGTLQSLAQTCHCIGEHKEELGRGSDKAKVTQLPLVRRPPISDSHPQGLASILLPP